jgi:hypothetical protein
MHVRLKSISFALAAALTLAAAPAQAGILFTQDFSGGLSANESLGGGFAVGGGKMGHVNGAYANNERSFYELTIDLSDVIDAMFSFDWTLSSERGWDGWNLLAAEDGQAYNPSQPLIATPSVYYYHVGALGALGATGNGSGRAVFDLTSFAGKTVNLRLQFASDHGLVGAGAKFDNLVVSGTPAPVSAAPEPSAWALMILGFMGAGAALRRRALRVA